MSTLAPELMPVLGTAYESKLAAQLEISRICLSNSIWLTTVASTPSAITYRCMLGVEKSTPRDLCCSCTIRCTLKAGQDEWIVRQSDPQHSCRLDMDLKSVRLARARGLRRLEALQAEEAEFGIQGRLCGQQDREDSEEDDQCDQLDSSDGEEATEGRRTRPRSVVEESLALPATEDALVMDTKHDEDFVANTEAAEEDLLQQSGHRKKPRISVLVHPRISRIMDDIDQLAQSGPVELPTPDNGISAASHTELRIIASAAAKQQGWDLALLGSHMNNQERASGRYYTMSCKMAHSSTKEEGRRLCGAFLKAQLQHGRWCIARSELRHNHPLHPPSAAWLGPWAQQASRSSAAASTPRQHSTPSFSTGISSHQHHQLRRAAEPHPMLLTPSSRSSSFFGVPSPIAQQPTSLRSTSPTSQPAIPHPFTPTLKLFLASISTSSSLVSTAPLLLTHGLDSINRLVFFLSLSEDNLNGYINLLAERGVPKMSTLLLKKGVVEARRRMREAAGPPSEESCIKLE